MPRSNNRCKKLTHEIWNSLDGTKIKKINKKLNFIRNETYLLLCHGSEYQNTPCEWHPPNPVPKGYPTNMEKGLICINLWLNHQSPNPKKGEWRKRVAERWILTERSCWVAMKLLREEGLLVRLSTKWSWKKAMVAQRKKSHKRLTKISVPVPLKAIFTGRCKTPIYC